MNLGLYINQIILLMLLMIGKLAHASSCPSLYINFQKRPDAAAYKYADVIFNGENVYTETLESRKKGSEPSLQRVRSSFESVGAIKGEVPEKLVLIASDVCDCKRRFEPGVRYVVYAMKVKHNLYTPFHCRYVYTESMYRQRIKTKE